MYKISTHHITYREVLPEDRPKASDVCAKIREIYSGPEFEAEGEAIIRLARERMSGRPKSAEGKA